MKAPVNVDSDVHAQAKRLARAASDGAAPALRLLFWETTAACNLACAHCRRLEASQTLAQDELTTDEARAMLRLVAGMGRPIVVFSGGEPLMQVDFSEALLSAAKVENLHCALETCGYAAWERFERVASNVDLFLYDIKETEPSRHVECTGVNSELILENLRRLHDSGAEIVLRLPIVPGLNDRQDHFQAVAELAKSLPKLLGVEVIPYHRLGVGKLDRMGLAEGTDQCVIDVETPDKQTVNGWAKQLRTLGATVLNGA